MSEEISQGVTHSAWIIRKRLRATPNVTSTNPKSDIRAAT
jgi:hypothetical protein